MRAHVCKFSLNSFFSLPSRSGINLVRKRVTKISFGLLNGNWWGLSVCVCWLLLFFLFCGSFVFSISSTSDLFVISLALLPLPLLLFLFHLYFLNTWKLYCNTGISSVVQCFNYQNIRYVSVWVWVSVHVLTFPFLSPVRRKSITICSKPLFSDCVYTCTLCVCIYAYTRVCSFSVICQSKAPKIWIFAKWMKHQFEPVPLLWKLRLIGLNVRKGTKRMSGKNIIKFFSWQIYLWREFVLIFRSLLILPSNLSGGIVNAYRLPDMAILQPAKSATLISMYSSGAKFP